MSTDQQLDAIYELFNELFLKEQFFAADTVLLLIDAKAAPLDLLYGVLTVTLAAKSRLSQRQRLLDIISLRPDVEPRELDGLY